MKILITISFSMKLTHLEQTLQHNHLLEFPNSVQVLSKNLHEFDKYLVVWKMANSKSLVGEVIKENSCIGLGSFGPTVTLELRIEKFLFHAIIMQYFQSILTFLPAKLIHLLDACIQHHRMGQNSETSISSSTNCPCFWIIYNYSPKVIASKF